MMHDGRAAGTMSVSSGAGVSEYDRRRDGGTKSDGTDLGADQLLVDIANYVVGYEIKSRDAVKTCRFAILDFVACALRGANDAGCAKLLGPCVPGVECKFGAHVPGTEYYLDPVTATFNMTT